MAETNSRPFAQDFQDEKPMGFVRPEEMDQIRGMTLEIPSIVEYMNSLMMCRLSNLDKDDRICSICREEFGFDGYSLEYLERITDGDCNPDIPLRLTCGHVFGNSCLSQWFQCSENCPYCGRKLIEKIPSVDTEAGLETHLGFLELCALRECLTPEDEETRIWLRERLVRLRAYRDYQEQREMESYTEERIEWYIYRHQQILLPDVEDTEETQREDEQAQEGSGDTLDQSRRSPEP